MALPTHLFSWNNGLLNVVYKLVYYVPLAKANTLVGS